MKQTTARFMLVGGFLMLQACIWGGGYLMHICEKSWAEFPALTTTLIFSVIAVALVVIGGAYSFNENNS